MLANMVAALDIISNGRLELGIGAGWNEEESGAYGIELGSIRERMDRFEEACQVLTSLLSQETTDFDGKYYQLKAARNEPKGPQRPTRRSASAAAAKNAPCVSPPATPSTGTLPAAQPRNSPASATSWPRTAPTSAATRRRSCCRRTCSWGRTAITHSCSRMLPRWRPRVWIWASCTSRRLTIRRYLSRWRRRSGARDYRSRCAQRQVTS
ncbi:luciferase-like monooxygenase family protein [Mycobacterium xenopi 3993]|nr:luciferase-like monooxygenase family protein [Mycobacterium xenopi 3993]